MHEVQSVFKRKQSSARALIRP